MNAPPRSLRVLFTSTAGLGHVHPLVPLAEACRARGHEIAFAGPASGMAPILEPLGFEVIGAGRDGSDESEEAVFTRLRQLSGWEADQYVITHVFGRLNTRAMVPDLIRVVNKWRPDVLVHESMEFGAWLVGELLNIPHVSVQIDGFDWDMLLSVPGAIRELEAIRREVGLPPDPALATAARHLLLVTTPASMAATRPLPAAGSRIRTTIFDRSGPEGLPSGWSPPTGRQLVYATLGSEAGFMPGIWPTAYRAILAGLGRLDATSLLTVGRQRDPDDLGAHPSHVRVENYVPQSLLLPNIDVLLCHGGNNTVLSALGYGIPMVIVPFFADQPLNAARCTAAGAALVLPPAKLSAKTVADALMTVLGNQSYRRAALALQGELEMMPGPQQVARMIEAVASSPPALDACLQQFDLNGTDPEGSGPDTARGAASAD